MENLKIAEVLNLRYEPGYFAVTNGHKGYEKSHYSALWGYVEQRGYGWATECKSSKLVLAAVVEGAYYEIWVDHYFKENLGRLTEKRRKVIEATCPKQITVEENESRSGALYYTACELDMRAWLQRVLMYL